MPLPGKFMNYLSQNGVIWCILGVSFLRFMNAVFRSPTGGKKNKTLVKYWGVATPATPAALTPMGRASS